MIVDRRYAELAAGENFPDASQQVWVTSTGRAIIESRLKAAGVHVLSGRTAASVAAAFARQGPALASVLFLADAAAAAVLAAGAAVLGLDLSARRRRYEYAALSASGVPRPVLRRSLLAELGLVLGFGSLTGVATGLAAAVVALRSVPEFLSPPGDRPVVCPVRRPAGRFPRRGRRAAGRCGGDGQRPADPGSQPRPAPGNRRMTAAMVRCEGLVQVYGAPGQEVTALRGVDLTVGAGTPSPCSAPPGPGNPPCCGCSPGC